MLVEPGRCKVSRRWFWLPFAAFGVEAGGRTADVEKLIERILFCCRNHQLGGWIMGRIYLACPRLLVVVQRRLLATAGLG